VLRVIRKQLAWLEREDGFYAWADNHHDAF
jgi:hypothetical protein